MSSRKALARAPAMLVGLVVIAAVALVAWILSESRPDGSGSLVGSSPEQGSREDAGPFPSLEPQSAPPSDDRQPIAPEESSPSQAPDGARVDVSARGRIAQAYATIREGRPAEGIAQLRKLLAELEEDAFAATVRGRLLVALLACGPELEAGEFLCSTVTSVAEWRLAHPDFDGTQKKAVKGRLLMGYGGWGPGSLWMLFQRYCPELGEPRRSTAESIRQLESVVRERLLPAAKSDESQPALVTRLEGLAAFMNIESNIVFPAPGERGALTPSVRRAISEFQTRFGQEEDEGIRVLLAYLHTYYPELR
ncbi:MAG: hypothetical protein AB7I45_16885 [Planctomycetota bacterium]